MLLLLLACKIYAPDVLHVEADRVRGRGEEEGLEWGPLKMFILQNQDPHNPRFRTLAIDQDATMGHVHIIVDHMRLAGNRSGVPAEGGRFIRADYLDQDCDLQIHLVDGERLMHARIYGAERGFDDFKDFAALQGGNEIHCGPLTPQPGDCPRGFLVATKHTTWGQVRHLFRGDWFLGTVHEMDPAVCADAE